MFNFDPSQMDPKVLMQMSELVRQLPPDKLNRMQSLMHNMMAGIDVTKDLEEFERGLPPGFREKLLAIVSSQPNAFAGASTIQSPSSTMSSVAESPRATEPGSLHEARLTILRAVADGRMTPDEAERLLF